MNFWGVRSSSIEESRYDFEGGSSSACFNFPNVSCSADHHLYCTISSGILSIHPYPVLISSNVETPHNQTVDIAFANFVLLISTASSSSRKSKCSSISNEERSDVVGGGGAEYK